jgi:bifunctional non-homologous end joining protein LigD
MKHMNWERFILDGELVDGMLHAFDVLKVDGHNICDRPYSYRFGLLDGWADSTMQGDGITVVKTAFTTAEKRAMLAAARANRAEGLVFKQWDAPYTAGRSVTQVKFKFVASASVIVAAHNTKRSVQMKLHDGTPLGNVTIPVNRGIPAVDAVIEVEYLYSVGSLVQAVYKRLREDTLPEECVASQTKKSEAIE